MLRHIGVTPWIRSSGPADWVEQGARAEELGFGSFWLPESHFTVRGGNPSPLLVQAAVAARTRRILLGTTSFLLPIRPPLLVAEEVAVLDQISNGRVILGVGRGFRSSLFRAFDVPVKEKRRLFEKALDEMRRAWAGEPVVPTDGDPRAEPVVLSPLPVQRPHPPIWVAAFGPKALAQAGRLGMPYLASPVETIATLKANQEIHRDSFAESHGPSGYRDLIVPVMRTVFVSRDRATCLNVRQGLELEAEKLRASRAIRLHDGAESKVDDWAWVGEPEALRDQVARYREELGMTTLVARGLVPGASPGEVEASLRLTIETLL